MTIEEILHLFESFSRGGAGTQFYSEGAGLGLYVAKSLLKCIKAKSGSKALAKAKAALFTLNYQLNNPRAIYLG